MVRRLNRFTERAFSMVADTTGTMIPPDGEPFDVDGIFNNAMVEVEAGKRGTAQSGGLTLNRRRPIFTVPTSACVGVSRKWHVEIDGVRYYVADDYPDGQGFTALYLANGEGRPDDEEGGGDGPAWR